MKNINGLTFLIVVAFMTTLNTPAKQTQTFSTNIPNYATTTNAVQTQEQPYFQAQQLVNTYASPLQGRVVMIPARTTFNAVTQVEYSTENLFEGQNISLTLPNAFIYNGTEIAPAGSTVQGIALLVKKAGHATRNAQLQLRFTSITTPYGQTIPISGRIQTEDGSGIIYGGTKTDTAKEYTKDVGIGAGAGAVGGLIMGALSGGSVGKGAAYGTAVGAGAGLAKSLWDKGGAVVIPANSNIEIMLDQTTSYTPIQRY